jgi:hypothetical protein
MISGATLAVCTQATRATGGLDVRVLVVPRALLDA